MALTTADRLLRAVVGVGSLAAALVSLRSAAVDRQLSSASSASHPAAAGASYHNSDSVAQGGFDEEGTEAGTVHVV